MLWVPNGTDPSPHSVHMTDPGPHSEHVPPCSRGISNPAAMQARSNHSSVADLANQHLTLHSLGVRPGDTLWLSARLCGGAPKQKRGRQAVAHVKSCMRRFGNQKRKRNPSAQQGRSSRNPEKRMRRPAGACRVSRRACLSCSRPYRTFTEPCSSEIEAETLNCWATLSTDCRGASTKDNAPLNKTYGPYKIDSDP